MSSAFAPKLRFADRRDWGRVTRRRFSMRESVDERKTVIAALLQIDAVTEPLCVELDGESICLADAGYAWLQQFELGARHVVTSMWDDRGRLVQHYIDICRDVRRDAAGIPFFEDLYLDIIILPGRSPLVVDEQELIDARRAELITDEDVRLAWSEINAVLRLLDRGELEQIDNAEQLRRTLAMP